MARAITLYNACGHRRACLRRVIAAVNTRTFKGEYRRPAVGRLSVGGVWTRGAVWTMHGGAVGGAAVPSSAVCTSSITRRSIVKEPATHSRLLLLLLLPASYLSNPDSSITARPSVCNRP